MTNWEGEQVDVMIEMALADAGRQVTNAHAEYAKAIDETNKAYLGDDIGAYTKCRDAERAARDRFWAAERTYHQATRNVRSIT